MTSPSDQLLAEQVRQGNEQAFVRLIRRYERTLARLIHHLSIAEIADRHRCPDGTVKRRLSHGRDRIRTVLGVTSKKRSKTMSDNQQPFPQYRPEIRIEASQEDPFRIDFKEMSWWFIVPEVGDPVRYASYGPSKEGDAPWRLSETVSLAAQQPAIIHGRSCVEVEVENQHLTAMTGDNLPNEKKDIRVKVWGHLAENAVEWTAVESLCPDGTRELTTFLDEGFYDDWGPSPRLIEDCGYLRPQTDGSLARQADAPEVMGAGAFDVHIGRQHFTCLRVFEIEKEASERDVMVEAYITQAGRTVLFRRYNGNRWAKKDAPPHNWGEEMTWEEDLPHTNRTVIDGVTYVHYYDNLTDVACGIVD